MADFHLHLNGCESHRPALLAKIGTKSVGQKWIHAHVDYPHRKPCLIWPFKRSHRGDYPMVQDPAIRVHRFMCEYRNGPPPTPKYHAGHSCNRGPDGCLNPWHLSWQTASENQLLRHQQHGPAKRRKLTWDQVDEIRSLKGILSVPETALRFGVCENTIDFILIGKTWKNRDSMERVFTPEEVTLIRTSDKSLSQMAKQLGASSGAIHRIRRGKTYKWVAA